MRDIDINKDIENIVNNYSDILFQLLSTRIKNPFDRHDIMQEVFIDYILTKTEFKNERHIKFWLFKVALNKSNDFLKKLYKKDKNEISQELLFDIPAETKESTLIENIRELPEKQGLTIYLYYYQGYSTREISKMLKVKSSTVRNNLDKGRANLEKILSNENIFKDE